MKRMLFLWILLTNAGNAPAQIGPHDSDRRLESDVSSVLDRVVRDFCPKDVVLLGEPSHHGSAKSVAFKSLLVPRLVDQCRFGAFFIESPVYDFLDIEHRLHSREAVSPTMLANAVGKIWSTAQEFQALPPYLLERARSGRLVLAGIDDQLSSTGLYAQVAMPDELSNYLRGERQTECRQALETHVRWLYDEAHQYGPDDKARLLNCLDAIQARLSAAPSSRNSKRHLHAEMVASLTRMISRDFRADAKTSGRYVDRDLSMFMNYSWLRSRLPVGTKIIVWTATVHAVKSAGEESVESPRKIPFGVHLRQETHDSVATLGFSALSGSFGRSKPQPLAAAPPQSLEQAAFAGTDSAERYLDYEQLRQSGAISARVFGAQFQIARWSDELDGLVMFREDLPPHFSDH